jgi:hypothetical protein
MKSKIEILVNITMAVMFGAIASGIVTVLLMMFAVMVTWIWYVFSGWAATVMLVTLCAAMAAEIYFALHDVEKFDRQFCKRCRDKVLPVMARNLAKGAKDVGMDISAG